MICSRYPPAKNTILFWFLMSISFLICDRIHEFYWICTDGIALPAFSFTTISFMLGFFFENNFPEWSHRNAIPPWAVLEAPQIVWSCRFLETHFNNKHLHMCLQHFTTQHCWLETFWLSVLTFPRAAMKGSGDMKAVPSDDSESLEESWLLAIFANGTPGQSTWWAKC